MPLFKGRNKNKKELNMGMDLNGSEYNFSVNSFSWRALLQIAEDNGWEPQGVESPGFEGCEKYFGQVSKYNYSSNDGQFVTTKDALLIANALERGFSKILECGDYPDDLDDPYKYFADSKDFFLICIEYFKSGGFNIF